MLSTYNAVLDGIDAKIIDMFDPEESFRGFTQGFLFSDFRSAFTIAISYVLMVLVLSSIMKMEKIPAVEVYPIKFLYNVTQIFLCAYMSIEAFVIAYRNGYSICCNDYDKINPPVANLVWLFYMSKILDFMDTVFIILGKKWRQLSFLHVYHHFTVFLIYWLDVNVLYDGDIYITILCNGFIHSVMYMYYFICMHTKVPETGKNLPIWWKSSLTMMQMIQFVVLMGQGVYSFIHQCSGCNHRMTVLCFSYTGTLLAMFANFYVGSYSRKNKKKTA